MFTRLRKRIIRTPKRNMSVPNIAPASVEFTEGILEEEERQVADTEKILKVYRSQSMQIAAEEMGESLRSITENIGLLPDEPLAGAQAAMESPRHVSCSIADSDFSTWRAKKKIMNKPLSSASQPAWEGDLFSKGRPVDKAVESELSRCYQRRKTWEERELEATRRRSSIKEKENIPAPQLNESTTNLDGKIWQSAWTNKDPEAPAVEPPTSRNSFLNWRQRRSFASSKIQFDAGGADDPLVDFEIELGDGRRIQRWKSYDKVPANNPNETDNEKPVEESGAVGETQLERLKHGSEDNISEDNLASGMDGRNSQSKEKDISLTGPKLSRRQRLIETQNTTSLSLSLMSRSGAPPHRPEEPSTSFLGKRWSLVEVYRAARRQKEERLEALRVSRKELDLQGDKTDVQRAEDLIAKCPKCPSQSLEASEDNSGDTEKGTTKKFDVSDHTTSTEESTEVT